MLTLTDAEIDVLSGQELDDAMIVATEGKWDSGFCNDPGLSLLLLAGVNRFIQIQIGQYAVSVRFDFIRGAQPLSSGPIKDMASILCRAFLKIKARDD